MKRRNGEMKPKVLDTLQGVHKEWLEEIARGDGREQNPQPHQVPVYGHIEPPLDEVELAAAGRPPRFATLGKITREKGTFETISSQTKQRWSRRREGNPTEQEQEWRDGAHEEVIKEHQDREVYNPDSKVIDWRHQKATDMRNKNKVHLPRARPKGQDIAFNSQEHLFDKI